MPPKSPKDDPNFAKAFSDLKRLLKPYEKRLTVSKNDPGYYVTETKAPIYKGRPLMFAGIRMGSYVAFHFFPVYLFPDMVKNISPGLRKRMQGKTCWNFKATDKKLFAELAQVVDAGFRRYESEGFL